MADKYYQLRERVDECASIGVVKTNEFGFLDIDKIKEAVDNHIDDVVSIGSVEKFGWEDDLAITLILKDGSTKIIDAEQTWLYF